MLNSLNPLLRPTIQKKKKKIMKNNVPDYLRAPVEMYNQGSVVFERVTGRKARSLQTGKRLQVPDIFLSLKRQEK